MKQCATPRRAGWRTDRLDAEEESARLCWIGYTGSPDDRVFALYESATSKRLDRLESYAQRAGYGRAVPLAQMGVRPLW